MDSFGDNTYGNATVQSIWLSILCNKEKKWVEQCTREQIANALYYLRKKSRYFLMCFFYFFFSCVCRKNALNDAEAILKLFNDEEMKPYFLHPKHPSSLPHRSSGSDWSLIFCTKESLHRLFLNGKHIIGCDGVWKWLRYKHQFPNPHFFQKSLSYSCSLLS